MTEIPERLQNYAVELPTTEPRAEFEKHDALDTVFGDRRIIGLGEATHGTREFFQLKHRLMRYLVVEQDVRIFAIEANFPEVLAINEYVMHGTGDPKEALAGIYFWTWRTESMLSMIEWMREFNEDRPVEDRVRFYGFDSQCTSGAVEWLREYFASVDRELPDSIAADLEVVDDSGQEFDYVTEKEGETDETGADETDNRESEADETETDETETDNKIELDEYVTVSKRVVSALREHLADNERAYRNQTSEADLALARQQVTIIEQVAELRQARHETDTREEPWEEGYETRDRAMAANVEWLLEFESFDRIVLWGHDAHVLRSTTFGPSETVTTMGGYLGERNGDDYMPVGFSFGRGSFQAIREQKSESPENETATDDDDTDTDEQSGGLQEFSISAPLSETLAETLDELGSPLTLVDLQAATDDEQLADWLSEPRGNIAIGALFDPDEPSEYVGEEVFPEIFDAVCYVAETSRARPLMDGSDED